MKDRVPAPGLAGRVQLTFEDDQSVRHAIMAMADGAAADWTPLNQATLLTDETAEEIGNITGDPTPNKAFSALHNNTAAQFADIGAQLDNKASIYQNAGSHNSIYRGKFLGNMATSAQYTAISSGTFDDLFIGDYWTINNMNYRIAAFDYYFNSGEQGNGLTTHHVTIVPDKSMYESTMNATGTTMGGYIGSQMYTTNLIQAKTIISSAFSGHIVEHRNALSNAVTSGKVSGIVWTNSAIELMNEAMVYGSGILTPVSNGSIVPMNRTISRSQLPLFAMRPDLITIRENYWLRDVLSDTDFAIVFAFGTSGNSPAYSTGIGIRPAFSIY